VEVDNFASAGFTEVSGLSEESETLEYREGGDNQSVRKTPGLTTYEDITLKRGLNPVSSGFGTFDMTAWRAQVHNAHATRQALNFRRDLDIVFQHRDGTTGARYRVINAWPKKLAISDANATSNEHLIEEMVIAHEGLTRIE
jgi:phage tail-like protein